MSQPQNTAEVATRASHVICLVVLFMYSAGHLQTTWCAGARKEQHLSFSYEEGPTGHKIQCTALAAGLLPGRLTAYLQQYTRASLLHL